MDALDSVPRPAQRLLTASWPLATAFGVRVRVHWTTALVPFAVFFALSRWDALDTAGALGPVDAALWTALATVLLCLVTWSHEIAHAWARRSARVPVRQVTLWPLGGLGHIEHGATSPQAEIFVGLAGPVTHAAWFILGGVPFFFFVQGTPAESTVAARVVYGFLALNAGLLVVNLLPFWPMDAGRVLRAAFALRVHPRTASLLTAYVGFAGAVVLAIVGGAVILQTEAYSVAGTVGGSVLIALAAWNFVGCRRLLDEAHWRPDSPYAAREPRPRSLPPAKWSLEEPTPAEPVAVEERRERRATGDTQPRRRESARTAARPLAERIDELLDRINEVGGIEKLSDAERRELADASERLRKGDR